MALVHKHLIIRAEINNPPKDAQYISQVWMPNLIEKIGMKILMGPYSVYCNMEGNRGLTAVTIIETSHIAMHSWDEGEPGLLQLDVYTCGPLDPQAVADAIAEFEPTKIERKYLDRETNLFQLKLPKPKKIKTDIKADIKDHLKKCWRTLSDSNPFNK